MPYTFFVKDSRAVGTGNPSLDADNIEDILAGLGYQFSILNTAWSGGADPTGAADSAPAINACEAAAAAAGMPVLFPSGTYKIGSTITKLGTLWLGSGRDSVTLLLASGVNADVVQTSGFSGLTLSGSTGGVGGWSIRDMTIDGNKAAQTGASYGLRAYGWNFDTYNLTIRNCFSDGLYTEWSSSAGFPAGNDQSMEARHYGLKSYNHGGTGWHNRGPHDSRAFDITLDGNGVANYWGEGSGSTTVAAGSNGVVVSTFAGAGVLNVATTLNFPAASISATQGSITLTGLTGGTGTCVITYTGVTATTFTGCTTTSGSGTLATGNPVKPTGTNSYSSAGTQLSGCHTYGASTPWGYIIDAPTHMIDCVGEVSATGMVLLRNNTVLVGGLYFVASGATQTGCGIQLGDAANGAGGCFIRTQVNRLACTSAATAALNIVADSTGNDIEISANAPAGSVVWSGSMLTGSHYAVRATGQTTTLNAANSRLWDSSNVLQRIPDVTGTAWAINNPVTGDIANINTSGGTKEFGIVNGYRSRWYADNYTTPALDILGLTGHIVPRSGSAGSLNPTIAAGANCTSPAINAQASDTAGKVTGTTVASPAAATSYLVVTFKNAFTNIPVVTITPTTVAAAQIQTYLTVTASGFTILGAIVPPAAADSAAVGWNYHVLGQDA